jgi:hypothetical protein
MLGLKPAGKAVVGEGIQFRIRDQVDAAAVAAVAAVGTAEGNVFLPPETDTTVAAIAGFNPDEDFIDKFHDALTLKPHKRKAPNGAFV